MARGVSCVGWCELWKPGLTVTCRQTGVCRPPGYGAMACSLLNILFVASAAYWYVYVRPWLGIEINQIVSLIIA